MVDTSARARPGGRETPSSGARGNVAGTDPAVAQAIDLRLAIAEVADVAESFGVVALNARLIAQRHGSAALELIAVEVGDFSEQVAVDMARLRDEVDGLVAVVAKAIVARTYAARAPLPISAAARQVSDTLRARVDDALKTSIRQHHRLVTELADTFATVRRGQALANGARIVAAGDHSPDVAAVVEEFSTYVKSIGTAVRRLRRLTVVGEAA